MSMSWPCALSAASMASISLTSSGLVVSKSLLTNRTVVCAKAGAARPPSMATAVVASSSFFKVICSLLLVLLVLLASKAAIPCLVAIYLHPTSPWEGRSAPATAADVEPDRPLPRHGEVGWFCHTQNTSSFQRSRHRAFGKEPQDQGVNRQDG